MTVNDAPKHIYVVNDVPELLDLFRELLEQEGYRLTLDQCAPVGLREQMERVQAAKPDLLILDFLVGGEPLGWQLLQMLKPFDIDQLLAAITRAFARAEVNATLSE